LLNPRFGATIRNSRPTGWWDNEPWPRVVGVGSTIGDTSVKSTNVVTNGDNEYGGGPALSALISWARSNYP
jgi:hypothetical protein